MAHQLKPGLDPPLPEESEQPAEQTKRHPAVVSYLPDLFLPRSEELQPVQERRREARVRLGVQGRALRREAQERPVVQAVLEVGPRSCHLLLVNLLPVGWLTNRENPYSTGSHPSMDSPASLP